MKPEVVEGARNLRAILASDRRPAVLAGLNLSQEELMLRLCNDVLDADLEVKGLEERLRHTDPAAIANLEVLLERTSEINGTLQAALAREKEISAELSKQLVKERQFGDDLAHGFTPKPQAFTPLAAALRKGKPKKKAKR